MIPKSLAEASSVLRQRLASRIWTPPPVPEVKAPAPEKKRGRVFIYTDRGKIIPYSELEKFDIRKSSGQIEEEAAWGEGKGLASRPCDPTTLLLVWETDPILFRIIDQIAIDTVGQGWILTPRDGEKGNQSEKDQIEELLNGPNPEQSLEDILSSMIIDLEGIGYCSMECVRNNGGKLAELYDLPAHTLWVHKGEPGRRRYKFCQKRGLQEVWFKRFGIVENFSAATGDEGEFTGEAAAHELIYLKLHYRLNDYYGIPPLLPALASVLGLIGIRSYNRSFFDNYGIPAYMVTLTGEWEEGSDDDIARFLSTEVKGSENAHRTIVLQLPEGGEIKLAPVSVTEREGSFRIFNQIWREDVLAAYAMPPYRIGIMPATGRLGSGKEAQELTEVYIHSTVEPLQRRFENMMTQRIIQQGLKFNSWSFKLNDLDIRNVAAEVEMYNSLVAHGAMTPNEERAKLAIGDPYPGGAKFYMSTSLKEIAGAGGGKK